MMRETPNMHGNDAGFQKIWRNRKFGGIGRCKNNMGIWCQIENNYENAVKLKCRPQISII